ncbi:uncharacterized protein LOC127804203 isoform X2 [Diospyros lotus]|uniref:uncharacterized protein LOC127804203 isoform X2 n=1 Tax=Diospyros lotus TaxID=55363 RepID=UPI002252AACA|nr:uncharacterized protein LOC127804203 isoform X2 [Diospyros lotus]
MVLGLKTKKWKSPTVHLDYTIHIQEVKPWPPSQSLRTLRSVLIQWEHGERNSGSTNSVVPLLGSGIGDGKIEFNESFRLPVTLVREIPAKSGDGDTFQKNCIEFNLYELRRDKTTKGQLLGTAVVDLADYGIVKDTLSTSVPMNSKRSFRSTAQPILFIKIHSIEKVRTNTSSAHNMQKEASVEGNGGGSVSALMNEEYAEEAEIASLADDDVSSHSYLAASSAAFEAIGILSPHREEGFEAKPVNELHESLKASSSCSSSTDSSSDMGALENGHAALSNLPDRRLSLMQKKIVAQSAQTSLSSTSYEGTEEQVDTSMANKDHDDIVQVEKFAKGETEISSNTLQGSQMDKLNNSLTKVVVPDDQMDDSLAIPIEHQSDGEDSDKVWSWSTEAKYEGPGANLIHNGSVKDIHINEEQENGAAMLHDGQQSIEDELWNGSQDGTRKQVPSGNDAYSFAGDNLGLKNNIVNSDRLKHVKSVRSPVDSGRGNGLVRKGMSGDAQSGRGSVTYEKKDTKTPKETRNITSDVRIQQLEQRTKMLEGELREVAALEAGLYSVVAEHGSSTNKVHAPARRLSRFYLHACKENTQSRRASAARSAVSGLVLVAKACGNDVPRLTFWLSNSVVLRAIISQAFTEQQLPLSARPSVESPGSGKRYDRKLSPLKWKEPSPSKGNKGALYESFDDWKDPHTFISALEKIEAWIFSRIIESVWWQTLTPHMQSAAAKAINRGMAFDASKTYQRTSSSGDHDQVHFSLELWKRAFKDACERLCPIRAGGHECGCLPILARLIMEQCVARLDVAMFNAILRESADEIPTDPVSDPISDAKVLPVPTGKASFGAGAQLKNAVGNWSRWLTDLFGIDDDDSLEGKYDDDDSSKSKDCDMSSKCFHLLNALSDLMMLPKDMLLSRSIRKEVCPTFGAPLIKRVLDNFVPDEFCPDPIPEDVLEALDSEDADEEGEGFITAFPCNAAPIVYLPPPAASVASIIGEIGSQPQLRRSGSTVLKKSYTSDDELDELGSPLTAIIDSFQASPTSIKPSWISKQNGNRNAVRYHLLREVWMNSE